MGFAAAAVDAYRHRDCVDRLVVLLHASRCFDQGHCGHPGRQGRRGVGSARRGLLPGAQISRRAGTAPREINLAQVASLHDLDHRLFPAGLDLLSRLRHLSHQPGRARAVADLSGGDRHRIAHCRLARLRRPRALGPRQERGGAGRGRVRPYHSDGLVLPTDVLGPRRAHPHRRVDRHDDGRQRVLQHHAEPAQDDRRPHRRPHARSQVRQAGEDPLDAQQLSDAAGSLLDDLEPLSANLLLALRVRDRRAGFSRGGGRAPLLQRASRRTRRAGLGLGGRGRLCRGGGLHLRRLRAWRARGARAGAARRSAGGGRRGARSRRGRADRLGPLRDVPRARARLERRRGRAEGGHARHARADCAISRSHPSLCGRHAGDAAEQPDRNDRRGTTDASKMGRREMSIQPFGPSIAARLEALAGCSDDEAGGLTRLYLSPAHKRAADLVGGWMREAGMSVRVSALADVVGRLEGARPDAKTLILGSHIDTVRGAGKYDGNLGVVTGIAVVDRLNRIGRKLPFAIEVVAFGDEEGVRFPSALGGSRALAGRFDEAKLDEVDADGVSRRDGLLAFGADPAVFAKEARDPSRTLGYVEVHIEQGPVLESRGLPVGVVTAIAGATRGIVRVAGMAGHAGTVPMRLRRDALAAAAEMILAIEKRALAEEALVATVGRLDVVNGAINTVPGEVTFTLDVRAPVDAARRKAVTDIEAAIQKIAAARNVAAVAKLDYDAPAAVCDPHLMSGLEASAARVGLSPLKLPSGAGHDGMALSGRIPFAMLFVRCRAGVSHNPAEFASVEDIDAAARVLADFIEHLEADVA